MGLFLLGVLKVAPVALDLLRNFSLGSSIFWSVITNQPISVKETAGRTNILILGIAGGDHEGADLTDTMIFASINLKTYDTTMVSIPRDIWVESLGSKINAAYETGEKKRDGGGLILSKAVVSEILGQPIHYAILLNFSGFKEMIDLFGGLDIEVERVLDDYKYPITGKENDLCDGDPQYQCRYEHLHFDKGLQHLDGEKALKFVRSRQAEGDEGTDFARSQRQQKVITALKVKLLSQETLLHPGKVLSLKNILGENIITDIKTSEIDDFLKLAKKVNATKINNLFLDTGDEKTGREGLLTNPPAGNYDGAWVLVPASGDWNQIQQYINKQLSQSSN